MSPEDVVRAQFGAWGRRDADQIVSHFTADAVWENVPLGVVNGHAEIRRLVEEYLSHMTRFDCEMVSLATAGNIVLTERVDRFTFDGKAIDARCMGAFEINDDKISAWRDYFDAQH